MKLKKIASLALAGVMAVSMLAGCATKEPTTPDDGEVVTETTDYSQEVGDVFTGKVPSYVKFEDDAALTAALQKAAQYVGTASIVKGYVDYQTLCGVPDVLSDAMTIKTSVSPDNNKCPLTIKNVSTQQWGIGAPVTLVEAEKNVTGDTIADAKVVDLYVVSTAVGEDALKAMIAEKLDGIQEFAYSAIAENGANGNFNYNYTVSVSTCTKTVNSSFNNGQGAADPSVTFVAVQVLRTGTHQ